MDAQVKLAILFGSLIIGYLLGMYIGRAIRMKEYAWKLGVILGVIAFAAAIVGCYDRKFGIDLKGGVILIYEVDLQKTALNAAGSDDGDSENTVGADEPKVNMNGLIQTLSRRINPSGVKEVVIRQFGENQVEIIIPDVDDAEIERIKRVIAKTGFLKFRIIANAQHHAELRSLAETQKQSTDPNVRGSSVVMNDAEVVIGEWVRVAKDLEASTPGNPEYKVDVMGAVTRELRPEQLEVLMAVDPDPARHVNGTHLANVGIGIDEYASPCVNFKMNSRGASLFGRLTSKYSPENNIFSRLGIVMDGELISAPRIQTVITADGRITGRFTEEEVQELVNVLEAGHLPAVLKSEPISTNKIKALLGEDTIQKGKFAIVLSLGLILVFMVGYYRFSGVIACIALAANLVLILALMTLISAAFTLPGLAGLVLTVGMSVDANVLIFERIREELNRGSALRMAIRNGFGKATTTIVDANVTTLITALVLYRIGTDQIRGFSVTLFLGILMSMFTAIFCSRAFFDIAERKRWITRLSMMQVLSKPSFNLIGHRGLAAAFSVLVIIVGCVGVGMRGSNIFDIDFLGGTSVQAVFKEPVDIEKVRNLAGKLAGDDEAEKVQVSVYQVEVETEEFKDRVFRIDTSLQDVEDLESKLISTFAEKETTLLETQQMSFDPPISITHFGPSPE